MPLGRMVRKVLADKKGLITEERFQKLTFAQWLFHYKEILQSEKEQNDKFGVLLSYLELVGSMANPAAGKKLQEMKELQEHRDELSPEALTENMEELMASIPKTLEIKLQDSSKFILPKYDKKKERKLGIDKDGEKK